MTDADKDALFTAAVDLIGRTGAAEFQIRYCEEEEPTVWIAIARWKDTWECASAMGPLGAVFRLCDQVIDGGTCAHCNRPAGFSHDLDTLPLGEHVCWYQWDPELKTFRRGCETEKQRKG